MKLKEIEARIGSLASGTFVEVMDLTGTLDHYQALIVSSAFIGKSMLEQHRMIYDLFQVEITSGELHALTLKTYTPEYYSKMR